MIKLSDDEFMEMMVYIRHQYGINLEKKRFLIESKLWIELARCKVTNYTDYWQQVKGDKSGQLEQRMMDRITTNYTYFCREEAHFTYLRDTILPALNKEGAQTLRIWCAACATGQECYTLAMHLLDWQAQGKLTLPFSIVGTDISETALKKAVVGRYNSADYARLPRAWQRRYCDPFHQGSFSVKAEVRDRVIFKKHNLLTPFITGKPFNLVFCRNVLIYFNREGRMGLVKNVLNAMAAGAYLFTGHTESLSGYDLPLQYMEPAVYKKGIRDE